MTTPTFEAGAVCLGCGGNLTGPIDEPDCDGCEDAYGLPDLVSY